jgi:threonine aldolase
MVGYLEGNHWIDNARHANAMARKLANGLATTPGAHLPWPTEANEVFVILPAKVHTALARADVKAAPWASLSLPPNIHVREGEAFWRFVTSFATHTEDIDHVIAVAHGA